MRRLLPYTLVALALVVIVFVARAYAAAPVENPTVTTDGGQP